MFVVSVWCLQATHALMTGLMPCLFAVIERKISVRSSREDLIRRGILKDGAYEGSQLPAGVDPVGDSGKRICNVLLSL